MYLWADDCGGVSFWGPGVLCLQGQDTITKDSRVQDGAISYKRGAVEVKSPAWLGRGVTILHRRYGEHGCCSFRLLFRSIIVVQHRLESGVCSSVHAVALVLSGWPLMKDGLLRECLFSALLSTARLTDCGCIHSILICQVIVWSASDASSELFSRASVS